MCVFCLGVPRGPASGHRGRQHPPCGAVGGRATALRAARLRLRAALIPSVRTVLSATRRALRRHSLPAPRARCATGPPARTAPPTLALPAVGHLGDVGATGLQPRQPAGGTHSHHAAPGHLMWALYINITLKSCNIG